MSQIDFYVNKSNFIRILNELRFDSKGSFTTIKWNFVTT